MNRGKTLLFWALTICLFGCPFIFYFIEQKKTIIKEHIQIKPIKTNEGITVHVHGELEKQGIYKVAVGTKIYELISDLNLDSKSSVGHLNLAKTLRDGQKIIIKSKTFTSDKLNINLATKKELIALPGIGKISANKIINHRQQNGTIKSFGELTNIIKTNQAQKIKSKISF